MSLGESVMSVELPQRIPIFPLPGTVFFPGTTLPLHIFEARYRQLVADHLQGIGVMGVILLEPGWQEDYYGSPAAYPVGCAGPMEDVVRLPDGRYTLRVEGHWKIEVVRYVQTEPYRMAEVRELTERRPDDSLIAVQQAKTRLLGAYASLASELEGRPSNPFSFDPELDYAALVNMACMHLGIDVEEKQRLLELHDVEERGRRIIRMLEEEHQRVLRLQELQGEDEGSVH
jgi:Lon protease-like protein